MGLKAGGGIVHKERFCAKCGASFYSKHLKTMYCSISCSKKGVKRVNYTPYNKGQRTRLKFKCKDCQKEFEVVPSTIKFRNITYCSKECYHKNTHHNRAQGMKFVRSEEYCRRISERQKGSANHRWKGGITLNGRTGKLILFKKHVKDRDGHKCTICESTKDLVVHHLNNYNDYEELRLELSNAITLCSTCHKAFHHAYGYKNNVSSQFMEFIKNETRKDCEIRERINAVGNHIQSEP